MGDTFPAFDVDMPNLSQHVERLMDDAINTLPFGVIRLDDAGNVLLYSDVERQISGFRKEAVNRSYFSDIAPCLDNEHFRGRIGRALEAGTLDIAFDITADLPSGARDVDLRVRIQSATGGGCWIFVKIED
jgi:photoactive yellow protein